MKSSRCSRSGGWTRSPSASSPNDGMLRVKDHGKVVAEIPNRELADEAPLYDRPHNVEPYRPAPMEAPEFGSRDLECGFAGAGRVGRSVFEALDLAAVRLHGSHQYHCRAGRGCGHRAHQGNGHQHRDVARRQWRDIARSIRARARSCWSRSAAAIFRPSGRLPVAATNNLNFGNPERPEIMAQIVEAIEGIERGLPLFRHSDYGRQCEPV